METIWVRAGKKPPFRPTLRLESTGFCPSGQWTGQMFKPGCYPGLKTIHEMPTVKEALAYYLSELKRCGHVEVERQERFS